MAKTFTLYGLYFIVHTREPNSPNITARQLIRIKTNTDWSLAGDLRELLEYRLNDRHD